MSRAVLKGKVCKGSNFKPETRAREKLGFDVQTDIKMTGKNICVSDFLSIN